MSNYTQITNFTAKDSLPSGNAAKLIKGAEHDGEYSAIQTAIATKVDTAGDGVDVTTTTASLDLEGLTSESAPDGANDVVAIYDNSAAAHRKVSPENLADYGIREFGAVETDGIDSDDGHVVVVDGACKVVQDQHLGVRVNGQGGTYSILESDGNTVIVNTGGSPFTFTLPAGSGIPAGWQCWITSSGGAGVIIGQGSGNTLRSVEGAGAQTLTAYGTAHIIHLGASFFVAVGNLT